MSNDKKKSNKEIENDEDWSDWSDEENESNNKINTNVNTNVNTNDLNEIDINFSHAAGNQFEDAGRREEPVHLRYKKRNGKKVITIVEGLTEEENGKYLKKWKKSFCCTGSQIEKEEEGVKKNILQFTGDCRGRIRDFLIENDIVEEVDIKIHGPNPTDNL